MILQENFSKNKIVTNQSTTIYQKLQIIINIVSILLFTNSILKAMWNMIEWITKF